MAALAAVYLDTSVILRKLLGQPGAVQEWGEWEEALTSEMARLESFRVLDRLRLEGKIDDAETAEKMRQLREILQSVDLIRMDPSVLERASGAFPTVLGALDAIHLASALLHAEETGERLIFLTHDRRLGTAAQASGLETRGIAS